MFTQAPYGWRHAALEDIKVFLESEVACGRFRPVIQGGLDLHGSKWAYTHNSVLGTLVGSTLEKETESICHNL